MSGFDKQFVQTSIAIWVLASVSASFLLVRLFCRLRYSRLGWDDYVLSTSWLLMLVAAALLSCAMRAGYATDDAQRAFYVFHDTATSMTTTAIAWTKVAFAITLLRIVRHRLMTYFLWAVIVTQNLILIPGMLSIWIPACDDPRKIFRPQQAVCFDLLPLQYLGGTTMVYGGVIDVLLALFPWFIIRKLLLETKEKIGLSIAMSLGALTGVVAILRTFYQFNVEDNDFDFEIFMCIFNFLEPSITIIAQTIPIFRVLLSGIKRPSQHSINLNSSTWNSDLVASPSNSLQPHHSWGSRRRSNPEHELFHVSGPYKFGGERFEDP